MPPLLFLRKVARVFAVFVQENARFAILTCLKRRESSHNPTIYFYGAASLWRIGYTSRVPSINCHETQ